MICDPESQLIQPRPLLPSRFIHIHRHPFAVYRSNVHMSAEAETLWQMHDPDESSSYAARFLDNYQAAEADGVLRVGHGVE